MKLIHIAKIFTDGKHQLLFLRKVSNDEFRWFESKNPTPVYAPTIEESLRLAVRHWKEKSYSTIICGFRYTLPERDEHGINALFHQMAASLSTSNGVYFDEELGNNCFVQNYSLEARDLFLTLRTNGEL
jgi:hypothetical protein